MTIDALPEQYVTHNLVCLEDTGPVVPYQLQWGGTIATGATFLSSYREMIVGTYQIPDAY